MKHLSNKFVPPLVHYFQKGNTNDLNNYWLMSIISMLGKIFDIVLKPRIFRAEPNSIENNHSSNFQSQCQRALSLTFQKAKNKLDQQILVS